MGGGMEGDWNNMNMGNMPGPDMGMRGPMGPGFHPMQGPGPGMGGNGPVMPGPRMRNNRRGGPGKISVSSQGVFQSWGQMVCHFQGLENESWWSLKKSLPVCEFWLILSN